MMTRCGSTTKHDKLLNNFAYKGRAIKQQPLDYSWRISRILMKGKYARLTIGDFELRWWSHLRRL